MSDVVTIHEVRTGKCQLSGKECDGVVATFADKSFERVFLSWNALKQIVRLKGEQKERKP